MKKLMRITFILIAFVLIFATVKPEATSASTYVNKDFAAFAKKGKLKGVYGNVNMTYKTLKKKQKGRVGQSESYIYYSTKNAYYGFFYGNSDTKFSSGQKVVIITKMVSTKVTASQMKKYFGKPVAWHTYKAGKYYVRYVDMSKGKVEIQLGTKAGMNAYYSTDEDGTITIK